MKQPQIPSAFAQLLQRKAEAQKSGRKFGVLASPQLSNKFMACEKPQPKIGRGGRNGSGKP